ncbi:MAG TPA: DegT/DnrJ/EryC1/StrS family aminotransferase [Caldilineaceae bacterium]|nr:DegT/DnrJ/EryC1/StrS family aminotransferase [Caldilineaceae bacterium]
MPLRQIPPTATPLRLEEWRQGLGASSAALPDFTAALAAYLGSPHLFLAASGRTALYLLFTALRDLPALRGRSQVVLPAYTCPAVAKVALDAGLAVRLVDVDPCTHGFVAGGLEHAVEERTLAVVCVHPFGMPQPVDEALAAARRAGAVVIEDAAQSLGARAAGRPVGVQGDFGLFSFGPGKPLSTGGGGLVCTADPDYAAALAAAWQRLAAPGKAAAGWALFRLGLLSLAFHPAGWGLATKAGAQKVGESEAAWGYALRGLSSTQAAVGTRLLARLDEINARRRTNALAWRARLQDAPGLILPPVAEGAIFLRFPLVLSGEDGSGPADRLQRRLAQAGIGAGRMYRRTLAEIFPALGGGAYPGAERMARGLLTLPTNHYVRPEDIDRGAALILSGV